MVSFIFLLQMQEIKTIIVQNKYFLTPKVLYKKMKRPTAIKKEKFGKTYKNIRKRYNVNL